MDLPWQRLHPMSLVANLAPRTWRTLRGSWPLFAAFLVGRRDSAFILFLVGLFFALAVWSTLIHFLTLRFRVSEGRLQIRSGLLNRQDRSLDPARIQNTELVQNLLHKALGLVEVRVETASGREVEGLLSGLSRDQGDALMAALDDARRQAGASEEPSDGHPADLLAHADVSDLLRYGATGLRLGAGIAVAVGLGVEGLQLLDPQQYEAVPSMLDGVTSIALLIAFVSGLFLLAIAGAVQRFWGFQLTLGAGRLVATQGLFTKRRIELRVDKVQLASVYQPIFRRTLGFATVNIETAAAHIGDGGTASAEAVVPVVHDDEIAPLLDTVVHGAEQLWSAPLLGPHPRALRRSLISAVIEGVGLATPVAWWFGGTGWALLAAVPAINAALAVLDHRHQGWRVTETVVVSRRGFLNRRTHLLSRNKIQSMTLQQGPLLRRWGLARLVVRAAGSRVRLPLLDANDADQLMDQLRPVLPEAAAAVPTAPSP